MRQLEKNTIGELIVAKVAIDIDETLYSFDNAVRNAFFDLAEKYGDRSILRMAYSNNHEWRNLVDHDAKIAFEAIERVHSNQDRYIPFPDCIRVVNLIYVSGHEIKYVGSRKGIHKNITEQWLDMNEFPRGDIICADPKLSKAAHIEDCQYLIDDRPITMLDFLNDPEWIGAQRKAFALWRPYNQNLTEVANIYLAPTWRGLEHYLRRKEVIT